MQQRERRTTSAPKRPAIRRIPPDAPRHTSFPSSAAEELASEHAEPSQPAAPISHVARRRGPSTPPPESGTGRSQTATEGEREAGDGEDGFELLAGSPDEDSRPIRKPVAVLTGRLASPAPLTPASATVLASAVAASSAPSPGQWRVGAMVAGGAIVMLLAGIAIGVALRGDRAHVPPAARAAAAPPAEATPLPSTPAPEAPAPPPVTAVSSASRPSVATVVGAEGHRLWVDGHLAEGFTALVSCGRHVVQVGSAGTPREIDVPCGEEIKLPR
jgi:hypothetical protein